MRLCEVREGMATLGKARQSKVVEHITDMDY